MDEKQLITLEKLKLTILACVSEELLDPKVDFSFHNIFVEDIIVRIKGAIYGEYGERKIIEYPSNWWQAFKEQHYPKFLLNKFPVRYIQHIITPQTLYPNYKISMPKEKFVLNILESKKEINDKEKLGDLFV